MSIHEISARLSRAGIQHVVVSSLSVLDKFENWADKKIRSLVSEKLGVNKNSFWLRESSQGKQGFSFDIPVEDHGLGLWISFSYHDKKLRYFLYSGKELRQDKAIVDITGSFPKAWTDAEDGFAALADKPGITKVLNTGINIIKDEIENREEDKNG